jgi:hypothetical protein
LRNFLFEWVGLSRFPSGLSQFFVNAVGTKNNFVELAWLHCFDSRYACAIFGSELHFRSALLGFRSFLFGRCGGQYFVERARLIVLIHIGLEKFFYWSQSSSFGVSCWAFVFFCHLSEFVAAGNFFVELARFILFFVSCRAYRAYCCRSCLHFRSPVLGFRNFLFGRR